MENICWTNFLSSKEYQNEIKTPKTSLESDLEKLREIYSKLQETVGCFSEKQRDQILKSCLENLFDKHGYDSKDIYENFDLNKNF